MTEGFQGFQLQIIVWTTKHYWIVNVSVCKVASARWTLTWVQHFYCPPRGVFVGFEFHGNVKRVIFIFSLFSTNVLPMTPHSIKQDWWTLALTNQRPWFTESTNQKPVSCFVCSVLTLCIVSSQHPLKITISASFCCRQLLFSCPRIIWSHHQPLWSRRWPEVVHLEIHCRLLASKASAKIKFLNSE